jgi:membrane-bound serine protease (ClpP class)
MRRIFFLFFSFCSFCFGQSIEQKLNERIHYEEQGPTPIGYLEIPMDRPIDSSTFLYVKFGLDHFKKIGAKFVLLKLNTPGGEVFAAQKIAKELQNSDIQDQIPVVAYIDNWAISAGAMLAYACRFIAISSQASMGAAEPVMMEGDKMQSASEKIISAIRSEFRNLASFYGRNPWLAEAMVDKDVILVYRGGQIVKLKNENEIKGSDEVISEKGKLLTLDAEMLMRYGVADLSVPVGGDPLLKVKITKDSWDPKNSGFFRLPFFNQIPDPVLIGYQDWRVGFFSFLSHPAVMSFLFLGLMLGFYIEIQTPGFGIAGGFAAGCFALILLSSFSVYAFDWIELILLASGALLLALEIFVIPGFGIAGILGALLFIAGLFALMLPNWRDIEFSFERPSTLAAMEFLHNLAWLCGALIIGFFLIVLLAKFVMPKFSFFQRIVLLGEQESKKGYISGIKIENLPAVGSEGKAYTPMNPSGKIEINGEVYDACTEGGFIDKGEKITIIHLSGNKLIVRKK